MPTGKITKETVDGLKAGAKDAFLWDSKLAGFGVKCTPRGRKTFIYQYRLGGRGAKTRRYTIGSYGTWTPDLALKEAKRLDGLVDQGKDPVSDKQDRQRRATNFAFDAYCDRFLEDEIKPHWKRSYDDVERALRLHVRPVLRSKPLPELRKADIVDVIDRIPAKQKALRRKVWAVLSRLFTWAVSKDHLERSPLEAAEPPPAPSSRDRTLDDSELRLAWLAADKLQYPFGPMYRILIGTGQRREEVAALDWKELNRGSREWRLHAERAKNEEANTIHLSEAMVAELDAIAGGDKWPRRGLVFTTTGKTSVSGYSRAKVRLDSEMLSIARDEADKAGDDREQVLIDDWRVHDLRRTLATGMQRLGVRFEVTEAILNHRSGSRAGVAGIYQRHHWRDEKREALNAWAAHIDRTVKGDVVINVVSLADRRA
jgi:integrase